MLLAELTSRWSHAAGGRHAVAPNRERLGPAGVALIAGRQAQPPHAMFAGISPTPGGPMTVDKAAAVRVPGQRGSFARKLAR